jgi:hypothetical protein
VDEVDAVRFVLRCARCGFVASWEGGRARDSWACKSAMQVKVQRGLR